MSASNKSLEEKNREFEKVKENLFRSKGEASVKAEELALKLKEVTDDLGEKDQEFQVAKELLDQRGIELNRLKEEVEHKNRQLTNHSELKRKNK